ncbi:MULTISPECIES: alpha/beta hydrolase [unclassified Leptolyngbya]|uniref:alpha/beta fold hydrolase n=1 Tax=unclassified Leptolyngbya TaxID=2650499 RepID=UPI001687B81E|nr:MULTISPECIES: alpha/beta hydrolase [unclassified Leptolyngbya]MBD1909786.1 alpha/beta hydrolase [Leptolyngbya sp. FACHB-8]MBD2158937.1 alpha/beta hydrolase [Leptolyngbya sp. FACHB-16]
MPHSSDALWLNVSPSLQGFDRPLLRCLSRATSLAQWEYQQTPDEPTSFAIALVLLHDYLKSRDRPIHLLGHGISGLLGLLYAQRHPERVRSLTLLSVGAHPAVDWQAHYYAQRRLLPCAQQTVLRQMVYSLLRCPSKDTIESFVKVLEQDLYSSLSPHNLFRTTNLLPITVSVPLLVCGSVDDGIIGLNQLQKWQHHFEHPASHLWMCPGGRYFFHYFYPQQVSEQITKFWRTASMSESLHVKEAFINSI